MYLLPLWSFCYFVKFLHEFKKTAHNTERNMEIPKKVNNCLSELTLCHGTGSGDPVFVWGFLI